MDISDFKPSKKKHLQKARKNHKTEKKLVRQAGNVGQPGFAVPHKNKGFYLSEEMIEDIYEIIAWCRDPKNGRPDFSSTNDFARKCFEPVIEKYKKLIG